MTVANSNDAPTLTQPLANQTGLQGQAFSFALPPASFSDIDAGDRLSYSATLASGAALPTWLGFDAASQRFTGTPANADVGSVQVRVTATDLAGATATGDFLVTVGDVNDAPVLAEGLPAQTATPGQSLMVEVPAATFIEIDAGDSLSYTATQANGAPLPAWLRFNSESRTFSGTPSTTDVGRLSLRVIASDRAGAQAEAFMALVVNILPPVEVVTPTPVVVPVVVPVAVPVPVPVQVLAAPAVVAEEATPTDAPPSSAPLSTSASSVPAGELRVNMLTAPLFGNELALGDRVFGDYAALGLDEARPVRRAAAAAAEMSEPQRPSGSRADAVLATALVAQLGDITLAPMLQGLNGEAWQRRLDELHRQMQESGAEQQTLVASGIAVTGGLSIGYVIWLVRGGVLLSSMLSALPAWQILDPLPVLAAAKRSGRGNEDDASDDDEFEGLFDGAAVAAGPAVPPPTPYAPEPLQPLQPTPAPTTNLEVDSR